MHTHAENNLHGRILADHQRNALRTALTDRLLVVCFGSGVDSTAMLVALHEAGLRPDLITFADTGGEKPETIAHVAATNTVLASWGWPLIQTCRKVPLPSTPYTDLLSEVIANEGLPSLAFGMKSCSIKWKQGPQDQLLKGIKSGPNAQPPHPLWTRAQETGQRIVKLIGYDCGRADTRRSKNFKVQEAGEFDYAYPLQIVGWARPECVRAIAQAMGPGLVPVKSACFFCPASKHWELYWLAGHHPELLERALLMERRALTGKHSRLSALDFGPAWDATIKSGDTFPSVSTTVGLGRSFAWNHWATVNGVVNEDFTVKRDPEARQRFLERSEVLRDPDNALDGRTRLAAAA